MNIVPKYFSFTTPLGIKIKQWYYQIVGGYCFFWILIFFFILGGYPKQFFFSFLTDYNLKNVLYWPENFEQTFTINLVLFWLSCFPILLLFFFLFWWICLFFTNKFVVHLWVKYFWLLLFFVSLSVLLCCWYFFFTETVSLNFRNSVWTQPTKLQNWHILTKIRSREQLSYLWKYSLIFWGFNCFLMGFVYLGGRIYFTVAKDKQILEKVMFFIMFSPLEQFEIISLMSTFYQKFIFSNSNFFFIIQLGLVFLISKLYLTTFIIPNRYQHILEQLYVFIFNLIEQNVNKTALKYFPFIFTLFLVILLSNFIGMVPYSFTITSHLIFTLFLSFLTFFGINFIGFSRHGLHFFGLFLPAGAPFILAPFLIFIELLSYIARVFSLAIRLFANLMSGHTLLKILSEFGWTMLISGGLGLLTFLFPFLIVLLITGLELAIAGLQAYVFTILTCIYFNDALNLH